MSNTELTADEWQTIAHMASIIDELMTNACAGGAALKAWADGDWDSIEETYYELMAMLRRRDDNLRKAI